MPTADARGRPESTRWTGRRRSSTSASAPAWLQGEALDAYLDRLDKSDGPAFSALAARLTHARDRQSLMAAARDLYHWKKDVIA